MLFRVGPRSAAFVVLLAVALAEPPVRGQTPEVRPFVTRSISQRARALEPSVLRERRVDLDISALGGPGAAPAERLGLEFFPDVVLTAILERAEDTYSGTAWVGTLSGIPLSRAVFVLVDGVVAGHITSPLGQYELIREAGGGYLIQQVDGAGRSELDDAVVPPDDGQLDAPADPPTSGPLALAPAQASLVDVLVAYTPAARAAVGGSSEMAARIDLMVALADSALRGAGTGGIRLVHRVEVAYTTSSDVFTTLSLLQGTSDGHLDEIHAMRNEYGADLVSLVLSRSEFGHSACGVAYSSVHPSYGFSVVRCVGGGAIFFAHEVGHNLGLKHDWYTDTAPGYYPSSKGYVNLEGKFFTIMANAGHCVAANVFCPLVAAFSNPRDAHNGFATGVAVGTNLSCTVGNLNNPQCDADGAGTLAETVPIVSLHRPTVVPRARLTAGQFLSPGESLQPSGVQCFLKYQPDGNLVAYNNGTPYFVAGTGGTSANMALMQPDGNFVIYDVQVVPQWSSGTGGNPGAFLRVQGDCNILIYSSDGSSALWSTGPPGGPPPPP